MNVVIIFLLISVFVALLIVFVGYLTLSYFEFLDRERRMHKTSNEIDSLNAVELKGFEGEEQTNNLMEHIIQPGEYYLRNLLIPVNEYKKAEIDGVLITRRGIFCIETKNWKGRLSGFDKDDMWYQRKCGKIKQLKNPVLQNEYHRAAIEKLLSFDYEVCNCVILSSTLDLNHIVSDHVYNLESFKNHYSSIRKRKLSRRKVCLVCDRLSLYLATSEEIKKHRDKIRARVAPI